ncbi:uncharacterized protein [Dendrobates tinctorius]|uniref:uncharacterized protein n=1 Tax=Dendrobates tinctorius TaxID=92724 RepID=UPI003CC95E80
MSERSDLLLLSIDRFSTIRIALVPKRHLGSYYDRAKVVGTLANASHMICSPGGELFCVRGDDLYRGPIPSKEGVDWFSVAKRVGKSEWYKPKIMFFHPNGELYCTTHTGELHKGPQPDNENVPWLYEQSTEIGTKGWDQCEAAFFHPDGDLYAVPKADSIIKAKPPTKQDFSEWNKTTIMAGGSGWLKLTYFMSFLPEGKLMCVQKENGNMYSGFIAEDGTYTDNADYLGHSFNIFPFLSLTKDKTISSIINFMFLPERGHRSSESAEVIEERVYNNRKSSAPLKHTFAFDKTVKSTSTFSHEHGFSIEIGASLKFKAGVPFIAETEATVHINASTTHNWSFTETNETEERFSSSSNMEVPPGLAVRVVASVMKANLIVPYRARVRTMFGFEAEVEGTWNGATHYNLMVTQEDYNK